MTWDLLELLDPVYSLKINDHSQMIQGIHIEDPEIYEQIRFVVESEHLEGVGNLMKRIF